MHITFEGTLLSFEERAYEPFADRGTGEMKPGGVKRTVWLLSDAGSAPTSVRVTDAALFETLREIGQGRSVALRCELAAYTAGKIEMKLVAFLGVQEPASSNGK